MMDFTNQEIIGGIAALVSVTTLVYYIISVLRGQTKPHLYTWIIWSILACIAFFAQLSEHEGAGSWSLGAFTIFCAITAILALRYGEKHFTLFDKIALGLALSAIIPWCITDDPLISVIMVSMINVIGFMPTFRKSWNKPYDENLLCYTITVIAMVLTMFALENFTLTTSLYNITIALSDAVFVLFCLWRRRIIRKHPYDV